MRRELSEAANAVIQETLSAANRPLASRRFQKAMADFAPGTARVVVGGGDLNLDGWINTDVYWRSRYYLDLMRPWPITQGTVDRVYADNVIEHFTLEGGRTVLRHLFSALRPGGVVRLATPDVERTAQAYLEKGDLADRHLDRHRRKGIPVHHRADLLRVTYVGAKHYLGYIYDYEALSTELQAAGFTNIRREEAGESSDPAFEGLEARATDSEKATALVVMAEKPA
jgi:predicted SAM-dependent methyltransferase